MNHVPSSYSCMAGEEPPPGLAMEVPFAGTVIDGSMGSWFRFIGTGICIYIYVLMHV